MSAPLPVPPAARVRAAAPGLALFALALALRLPHLGWGLPFVFEEATPLRRAWEMAGWGPWEPFDPNPHFFRYPGLVLYLHLAGQGIVLLVERLTGAWHSVEDMRVAWEVDPGPLIVGARAITAALGAVAAAGAASLGRRLGGTAAGILAGLLVAANGPLIDHARRIEVDTPLMALAVLALVALVRAVERPAARRFLLAGLAIGLATSAKYPGAVLVVPLGVAVALADAPGRRMRLALVALAGAAAAFLLTSPYTLLDFGAFRSDLLGEGEHMRVGHFGLAGGTSWGWYAREAVRILGWPAALAAIVGAGLGLAAWRGPRGDRARLAIPASFVLVTFAVVGSWSMKAAWYLLPIVPPALVLAAVALAAGARALAARAHRTALVAGALALGAPALAGLPARLAPPPPDPRAEATRWIESEAPPGAFVLTEAYGPELLSGRWRWTVAPELWDAVTAARGDRPEYAVQTLPMFQVRPEESARYYDPALWGFVDLVVTTNDVAARYRREPERFAPQLAFYRDLEDRFTRLRSFGRADDGEPAIVVWFNPRQTVPFGWRDSPGAIPTLGPPGDGPPAGEAEMLIGLGGDFETFGFVREAIALYEDAARWPIPAGRGLERRLVGGLVRCRVATGRRDEAVALLERAIGAAGTAADRAAYRRMLSAMPPP